MSSDFTLALQNELARNVRCLLTEWLGEQHSLEVGLEKKPLATWRGHPDIWIIDRNRADDDERVAIIEIEHVSAANQAANNIYMPLLWLGESHDRRATILQIFSTESRAGGPREADAVRNGYDMRIACAGQFQYDSLFYDPRRFARGVSHAREVSGRPEFHAMLWQHLRFLEFAPTPRGRLLPLPLLHRHTGGLDTHSSHALPRIPKPPGPG